MLKSISLRTVLENSVFGSQKVGYGAPKRAVCIRNISDYSPFGVSLDGRTIEGDGYRFGFQNQEKDDELKGTGNSVNYKYRMHDPRVGRFFSIDPLASKYPYYSSYQFSGNRLIDAIELEGLELKTIKLILATHSNGDIYIKKCTVLKIVDDYNITVNYKGKDVPGSETQVIYSYEGEKSQHMFSIFEPKDYGSVDARFKGIYSSAKYDFTSNESIKQKMDDDLKWVKSFETDPIQSLQIIQKRDNKAPDAIYTNQGLNDILDAAPSLAGTQWLFFGKIKIRRDYFHKEIKPKILGAANKSEYQKVVGRNPDIRVSKNNKIELSGTGDFKGKSYKTNLDADEYLKK